MASVNPLVSCTCLLLVRQEALFFFYVCYISVQYGLYSSFIAQFIYVLMGTSKDAAVGPSAIVSMMVGNFNAANPIIKTGDNTYSCLMAFMSGIILMSIGSLRLGFIVNLFSIPVVSGFTCASGFTIFASQLKPFFGLKDAPNDSPAVFVKQIINVFKRHEDIKTVDVIFGSSAIAFLVFAQCMPEFVERLLKIRNRRRLLDNNGKLMPIQTTFMEYLRLVAASRNVFVFVFTTLAAYLLISADPSFESRISIVHKIEPGLPPPRLPALNLVSKVVGNATNETTTQIIRASSEVFTDLIIAFIIVPMMIMLETFAITKALGRKNGYRIDATNELIAVGLGNFIQSFFQAFPVSAAVTRCALNDQCKVRTQLGSVISAFIVIIAMSALTQTFYYIPKAALAGIIMTAAYNLIDFGIVKPMWREYKQDVILFFLTFFLCLFFDMAYGILICILVNVITFLRPVVRMALVVVHEKAGETNKSRRTTVVKLSHGMKYPSADKFLDRMSRIIARSEKHIIVDCQFFTGVDYTGLQALRGIILLAFRQNKHLIFTNMSDHLLKKVENIGLDHWLYVDSIEEAVKHYNEEQEDSLHHELQVEVVHHGRPQTEFTRQRLTSFAATARINSPPAMLQVQDATVHEAPASIHGAPLAESVGEYSGNSDVTATRMKHEDVAAWVKKQEEILRHLSVQAYFYQDIPISIGNVGNGGGMMMGDEHVGSSSAESGQESETDDSDDELETERWQRPPRPAHHYLYPHHHPVVRRRKSAGGGGSHRQHSNEKTVTNRTVHQAAKFGRRFSATMVEPNICYEQELAFPSSLKAMPQEDYEDGDGSLSRHIHFSNNKASKSKQEVAPPETVKSGNNKKQQKFGSSLHSSVRSGILKDTRPMPKLQRRAATTSSTNGSQQSFYSAHENLGYEPSPHDNNIENDETPNSRL